jgi:hypothetical protein
MGEGAIRQVTGSSPVGGANPQVSGLKASAGKDPLPVNSIIGSVEDDDHKVLQYIAITL